MATQATTARGAVAPAETVGKAEQRPFTWYLAQVLRYFFLILMTVILLGPLVLAIFGSFKTNAEVLAWPPKVLPSTWNLDNFVGAWNNVRDSSGNSLMPRWIFNSIFLSAIHVVLQLFFCSLAGFAFARLRFKGQHVLFAALLATMMVPGMVLLIPRYLILNSLHMIDTYWAMIVPFSVGAFGIFLLTQFLKSIPRDLEEAAMIDGAGIFTTYWRVVLPLAKPALAALAIISFQGMWNNFLDALIFMQSLDMYTLPVGLGYLKGTYATQLNLVLAGSMFNTIPVLLIFAFFSRYFIQGVTYSGVKG
jgi:ABC-type glycerol-3-phosphate transport system permease component